MSTILFTGGSGLLGSEMQELFGDELFPDSSSFNVTSYENMDSFLRTIRKTEHKVKTIVHMAATTSLPKIEENPRVALATNITGTSNIVELCVKYGLRLVYISTDYVFDGSRGMYSEGDPMYPVNKYAWSKLGGECAVRMMDKHTIIRLSFGPDVFPYDSAFVDQWSSKEPVSEIATKVAVVILSGYLGTIHVGSERRTVYEYAKEVSPEKEIGSISTKDIKGLTLPKDVSLDTSLYDSLVKDRKHGWKYHWSYIREIRDDE